MYKDQEIKRQYMKRWRKKKNLEYRGLIFQYYGAFCSCCGETTERFLTVDHVNGGGSAEKSILPAHNLYRHIVRLGFPNLYRVLCFNCNLGRALNEGVCPHKQ